MKKILAMLLALMLVLSLAACGDAENADDDKVNDKVEDNEDEDKEVEDKEDEDKEDEDKEDEDKEVEDKEDEGKEDEDKEDEDKEDEDKEVEDKEDEDKEDEDKEDDFESVEVGTKLSAPEVTPDEEALCNFYFKLTMEAIIDNGDDSASNKQERLISVKGYNTDCVEYYDEDSYGKDYYRFDTVEKTVFCGYESPEGENIFIEKPYAYESSYDQHWEMTFGEISTYTGIGMAKWLEEYGVSLIKCEDEDGCLVYAFDLGENADNTPMSDLKMYIDKENGIAVKLTGKIIDGDDSALFVCTVSEYSLTEHRIPDIEISEKSDEPEFPAGPTSTEIVDNGDGTMTVYTYDEDGNLISEQTVHVQWGVDTSEMIDIAEMAEVADEAGDFSSYVAEILSMDNDPDGMVSWTYGVIDINAYDLLCDYVITMPSDYSNTLAIFQFEEGMTEKDFNQVKMAVTTEYMESRASALQMYVPDEYEVMQWAIDNPDEVWRQYGDSILVLAICGEEELSDVWAALDDYYTNYNMD